MTTISSIASGLAMARSRATGDGSAAASVIAGAVATAMAEAAGIRDMEGNIAPEAKRVSEYLDTQFDDGVYTLEKLDKAIGGVRMIRGEE